MPKPPSTNPFQAMEEEAYHAFLEWPLWLALREKELAAYLDTEHPSHEKEPPRVSPAHR